jgi:hypothetical protein
LSAIIYQKEEQDDISKRGEDIGSSGSNGWIL